MSTTNAPRSPAPRRRRSGAVAAGLLAVVLASCAGGGPGDGSAAPSSTTDTIAGEPIPADADAPSAPEVEVGVATDGDEDAGSGGGAEPDETIPPYDGTNDRTEEYDGVPEPCLLLTPALVSTIHGPFDLQQQVGGPGCVYISADPLFEVSLFTLPTSTCDGIVDDLAAVGRPAEDEAFEGRLVSWSFGDGNGNALIFEPNWCFQLRVLHTGADRATMTGYVDLITDALG